MTVSMDVSALSIAKRQNQRHLDRIESKISHLEVPANDLSEQDMYFHHSGNGFHDTTLPPDEIIPTLHRGFLPQPHRPSHTPSYMIGGEYLIISAHHVRAKNTFSASKSIVGFE